MISEDGYSHKYKEHWIEVDNGWPYPLEQIKHWTPLPKPPVDCNGDHQWRHVSSFKEESTWACTLCRKITTIEGHDEPRL